MVGRGMDRRQIALRLGLLLMALSGAAGMGAMFYSAGLQSAYQAAGGTDVLPAAAFYLRLAWIGLGTCAYSAILIGIYVVRHLR
jgi:hypothetical protein